MKTKSNLSKSKNIVDVLPGLVLAIVITLLAYLLSKIAGGIFQENRNPFSPILCAIILGLLIGNVFTLNKRFSAGINFGIKKLLKIGIVLMGIGLSFFSLLKVGAAAVGIVFLCIVSALLITMLLAKKMKISSKLGTLIAAGTSICGVSAIVAISPAIDADEEETAYAIGTITIFGLLATILYPYLTELVLNMNVVQAGYFLGTSVHDTSQVTGTALMYDQLWGHSTPSGLTGADIAITAKLVRNTFMVVVIPLLGYVFNKKKEKTGSKSKFNIVKHLPVFVLGYVIFGLIRSLGDLAFGQTNAIWISVWKQVRDIATYIISAAIVCVGLNTDIRKFAKLGIKPLIVGLTAAVSVGLVSFILVTLFNSYLIF